MNEPSPTSPEARHRHGRPSLARLRPSARAIEVTKRVAIGTFNDGFTHAGNLAYLSLLTLFPFFIVAAAIARAVGRSGDSILSDAGPWEGIPVSLARAWAPELPVIGVFVDIPKPAFLAGGVVARMLRGASSRLGVGAAGDALTARRYLGLLAARWADPVVVEPPDVLIAPRLGRLNALQFGQVDRAVAIGERDARLALASIGTGNH